MDASVSVKTAETAEMDEGRAFATPSSGLMLRAAKPGAQHQASGPWWY
jgi:gamma-glutamylcyclotransferase